MLIHAEKTLIFKKKPVWIDQGVVVIGSGIIQALGRLQDIAKHYPRHPILHLENAVLLPGLVNVHTHLELPDLRRSIRSGTFSEWVLSLIREKKKLREKDYFSAGKKNIDDSIQSGTTTVGEICTHGISQDLLARSGLRGTVFQEIIDMDLNKNTKFKVQSSTGGQSILISNGLSPHSPYTVSDIVLRQINKIATEKKLSLCMHVAESKDEIKLLQGKKSAIERIYDFAGWEIEQAAKGRSSFDYLNNIGFLSPHLLAVHAVQVTDEDIRLIKKSRTAVAHCPRSNKELGCDRMPLKKFLNAGITVGLGTDSLASSPSLNMWDEMRYALKIHRRDGITAQNIFKLATIGGAKALGLDKEIGTLEVGKRADLIAVPLPSKNTGDIYSDLLRETNSCIMTMVNGKILFDQSSKFSVQSSK